MHDAKRGITGGHVADEHTQGADIVEAGKIEPLLLHFSPDRADVLGSTSHLCFNARVGEGLVQHASRVRDPGLAITATLVEQVGNAPGGFRLQIAESQILKLPLELPDAQAIGQRCMDVGGELGEGASVIFTKRVGAAHQHQLPGKQDEDYAQVADDRQQQPSQAFCSTRATSSGMQRPDFFRRPLAFDQIDNLAAEGRNLRVGKFAACGERFVNEQGRTCDRASGQFFEFGKDRIADGRCRIPTRTRSRQSDQLGLDTLKCLIVKSRHA